MPIATRTFRVFVSSTFEDLKAERDALQRHVFPRLRKLCEANNARFQAIDRPALNCLAVFTCNADVRSCAWGGGRIVAGDKSGKVHLFAWEE